MDLSAVDVTDKLPNNLSTVIIHTTESIFLMARNIDRQLASRVARVYLTTNLKGAEDAARSF